MNAYSHNDFDEFVRRMEFAAEQADHEKRRPRATKHDTTAFYNFRHKRRKIKGGKK